MEFKKPAAVILAGAFAVNAFDPRYGVQIFTDLPPMTAAVATASVGSSVSNGQVTLPFYSTMTDELIEAPLPSATGPVNPSLPMTLGRPLVRV